MLRKFELLTIGALCLFIALLASFAPGFKVTVNLFFTHASSLVSQPPAASFKWSMPKRFGPRNAAGIVDYHWTEATQTYASSYVNPTSWKVDFDACNSSAASSSTYQWEIDGVVQDNPSPTVCTFAHEFTSQKPYLVKLTVTTPDGQAAVAETVVTIKDLLIVSLGDSFASGQGNPDIPKKGGQKAKWVDNLCSRSAFAGPAQAAFSIEQADSHTSVTFVSLACSGATINAGLIGSFPKGNTSLPPQVDKLKDILNGRQIDALLISIGGNDIGFANLVAKCILDLNCSTSNSAQGILSAGLNSLQSRYQALSEKINGLPPVKRIFITEYPDLARNQNGQFCNNSPLFDLLGFLSRREAQWASEEVVRGLNDRVKAAADQHGWVYVGGIADKFATHGYCAGDQRWVRTFGDAKKIQGTDNRCDLRNLDSIRSCIISSGSVHPSEGGHAWYATRLIEELQRAAITSPVGPQ